MSERDTVSEAAVEAAGAAVFTDWRKNMEHHTDRVWLIRTALEAALPLLVAEEMELLEDVATQFAYRGISAKRRCMTTGGLSTLEAVFAALGWDDPHYVDDGGCEQPGCPEWATCGTPTRDGYKRLCSEHYQAAIRADKGGE